ncbi:hypothetical protein BDV12DRAFT_199983 [Aspergillus spectabilis]
MALFPVDGKTALLTFAGKHLLIVKCCNVLIADLSVRPEAHNLLPTYTSAPRALFHKTGVSSQSDSTSLFTRCITEINSSDLVFPGVGVCESGDEIWCCGVAQGLVQTPLFTEDPEKLSIVDEGKDRWATAEDVTGVLLDLAKGEYEGGGGAQGWEERGEDAVIE